MEKENQKSNPEIRFAIEPGWLNDINLAVQVLTGLSIRFSAQAALITKGDELWAYAGQLPQAAAVELGKTIIQYSDKEKNADLMRFIDLDATKEEHKIYASQLTNDITIGLVYESETPFSVIRAQASELLKSLSNNQPNLVNARADRKNKPNLNTNTLRNILANNTPISNNFELINEIQDNSPHEPSVQWNQEQAKQGPVKGPEDSRRIRFEESSQAMYNLTYACLLIPRFPNHHMEGDLAMRLSEWIPQICIAYGWRLEYISIQQDHLQWIVSVPPTTAPGGLMRIIRKQLSEKILVDFPRIKNENPSGDFWAPGYYLTSSSNPHPAQLVREFIEQTRMRQGIS
jgi:REP element-mobilizing transposase RayT